MCHGYPREMEVGPYIAISTRRKRNLQLSACKSVERPAALRNPSFPSALDGRVRSIHIPPSRCHFYLIAARGYHRIGLFRLLGQHTFFRGDKGSTWSTWLAANW